MTENGLEPRGLLDAISLIEFRNPPALQRADLTITSPVRQDGALAS